MTEGMQFYSYPRSKFLPVSPSGRESGAWLVCLDTEAFLEDLGHDISLIAQAR